MLGFELATCRPVDSLYFLRKLPGKNLDQRSIFLEIKEIFAFFPVLIRKKCRTLRGSNSLLVAWQPFCSNHWSMKIVKKSNNITVSELDEFDVSCVISRKTFGYNSWPLY